MVTVIKFGTNCHFLHNQIDNIIISKKAKEIEELDDIVLVVSGAIKMGKNNSRDYSENSELTNAELQGYASIGQWPLINLWQNYIRKPVAQVLLTKEGLNHENHINDLVKENLKKNRITMFNYNDSVDFEELRKDNDTLAATITNYCNADRLIILGRYNGLEGKDGKVIHEINLITPETYSLCNGADNGGLGGFKTKIEAAEMVMKTGKEAIIGSIYKPIKGLIDGSEERTIFREN